MKIEILQEELLNGLVTVLRAVSPRVQLPVLSHVLMEATPTGINLTATDLEIGIRVKVMGKVEVPGVAAVPGKMLTEFLATLSPGKVSLELKDGSLKVKSAGYAASLQTMEASEFPRLPELTVVSGKIQGRELEGAIERVVFASAKETLRPVLTGVLIETGKKLKMVATDGFRLAIQSVAWHPVVVSKPSGDEEGKMLVPARVMAELPRMMKEEEIEIGHLPESHQVIFRSGDTVLTSQLLEGSFPDYQKILPKEFLTEITVGREELLSAVRTAHVFARENSNMMRWEVGEGKIAITSSSPERGECRAEVEAKIEGEGGSVVFNAKYVMDYLGIQGNESVWVGIGGKLAPGMFRSSEEKDGLYVVMPINV